MSRISRRVRLAVVALAGACWGAKGVGSQGTLYPAPYDFAGYETRGSNPRFVRKCGAQLGKPSPSPL